MKLNAMILLIAGLLSAKQSIQEIDFTNIFKGYKGTIVVYDSQQDNYFIHNIERANRRFSPFSTYKIANSIIALETKVLGSTEEQFIWDTSSYPVEQWWPRQWLKSHTMRSAIKFSVVPFYREIATRVGKKRMQEFVEKFNYGNKDISSGEDDFWLNGSLSISAMEQIEFLRNFYNNSFWVSPQTISAVKDILVQEESSQYRLSAKTGAGTGIDSVNLQRALGWYVGYVEKGTHCYYFAMNIEGESFDKIIAPRKSITMQTLRHLKIIE